jgi:NDP-sugar pyrophosphorylase family protein
MVDAVILCAGQGKRLRPFTDNKPKALVEIKDRPIINWLYDNLMKVQGIDYIYVVGGYRFNVLKPYVKTYLSPQIRFKIQFPANGTANAISLVKNYVSRDFIVLAGDTIFNTEDLQKLVSKKNSLLYTEIESKRLYEYGTLDMVGDRILHINEKDTNPTSNLVNCSAYHFDYRVFDYIDKTLEDSRFKEKIVTNTINLMINDGIQFSGIEIKKLLEISYPSDIKEVESQL